MSESIPMAFPQPDTYHAGGQVEYGNPGMSLRDWFAGQALIAIVGHPNCASEATDAFLAKCAYDYADAMLAARSKEGREP